MSPCLLIDKESDVFKWGNIFCVARLETSIYPFEIKALRESFPAGDRKSCKDRVPIEGSSIFCQSSSLKLSLVTR